MNKNDLRKEYIKKRLALSAAECLHFSRQLTDLFFSCEDLTSVRTLHTFLPIPKNNEPDTWLIVDRIRREFPHIRLSLPRVNHQSRRMENFYFEGLSQLVENKWGIFEPQRGVITPSGDIDMVLVPLLAFDSRGHRVGYGKGYYDRFLATCRKDCRKTGLSFFDPVARIDMNPHDEPLNAVVTPHQYFQFRDPLSPQG